MVRRIPGPVLRGRAQPIKGYAAAALLTDILGVNVDAGFSVVNQVPIWMVRIVIDNDVVGASPAPVGGKLPIIWKDFKTEAAVKPETVLIPVDPTEAIRMRRAEIVETAVRIRLIHVEARIVLIIVAIPCIVADVGPLIHSAVLIGLVLRRTTLRPGCRRRRNLAAVAPVLGRGRVLRWSGMLPILLRNRTYGHHENQNKKWP